MAKKLFLLTIFLLMTSSPFCADLDGKKDEWLFIPVSVPEGRVGGGDFYSLKAEPADGDYSNFESRTAEGGVAVRSDKTGEFTLQLIINHITKPSCAGVDVSEFQRKEFSLRISD